MAPTKETAFIFDVDGTIVDTEEKRALSLRKTINFFGKESDEEIYKECIGHRFEYVVDYFLKRAQLEIPFADFKTKFDEYYNKEVKQIRKTREGFIPFLNEIKSRGFKTGLVTSGYRSMLFLLLQNLNLAESFDTIITKEDVQYEKPSPEPYLKAIERLRITKAIVFEDTTPGFCSASEAGAVVFGMRHKYNEQQDFSLPVKVFETYNEVKIEELLKIL